MTWNCIGMLNDGWYALYVAENKPFYVYKGDVKYYIEDGALVEKSIVISPKLLNKGFTNVSHEYVLKLIDIRRDREKFIDLFNITLEQKVSYVNGLKTIEFSVQSNSSSFNDIESEEDIKTILVKQQKPIM